MIEPWLIAVLVNAGLLIAVSIRTTWKIGDIKADVIKAVTDHAHDDVIEFGKVRGEIDDTVRAFGETIGALRQKVNDVQLEASQNYVRRDGFWKAHDELRGAIADMRTEVRTDINRLELKIEGKP